MFDKLVRWFQTRAQEHESVSLIKKELPKGYFLAYVEVCYPNGTLFCQDPVLIKNDPKRFKVPQPAAFIYPGFTEPCLYENEVKDIVGVKPFGPDNYLHYAKDPNMLSEFLANIAEAKIALDDEREQITVADKKDVDDLKVKINEILDDKYFLLQVGTMLGSLPVITKTIPGTSESIPCAHLYPGAQTDALDGAPKKTVDGCITIPPEVINSWLFRTGNIVLEDIKTAIIQLERPERHVDWYEIKPE